MLSTKKTGIYGAGCDFVAARSQKSEGAHQGRKHLMRTFVFCFLTILFLSGCRQDMHDQPKYEPLEPINDIGSITDGRASRPVVEGTVARGSLDDDPYILAARSDAGPQGSSAAAPNIQQQAPSSQVAANVGGQGMTPGAQAAQGQTGQGFSNTFPFPITVEVMDRGEERYNIFCSMCHDRTGSGSGMVVRRGYRKPPSFHEDRLRQAPAGYFFDVITNGFGAMPDYSAQINPRDRWAIVAYIRALQLSQRATLEDVPPDERGKLNQGATQQRGNQR
ncbi:MAG TPA: cytochrome c [Blastocatellia bacterium]|nr:cytochrome c [Blastocatellia bacterium]